MAERTFQFGGGKNSPVSSRLLGNGFPVTNQQTSFFFPTLYQYKAINLSALPVCHKRRHEPYNLQLRELKKGEKNGKFLVRPNKQTNSHSALIGLCILITSLDVEGFFYSSTLLNK